MRFQREKLTASLCEELKPLLERHYLEIAHYQDIPLDPDYEQYVKLEDAGVLRVFTARESKFSMLAGYAIFFVKNNLHYKASLQAIQDIIFVHPGFRSAGFGAKLITFCDEELQKEKVQVVYHHVKEAHNFGPLLEKIGYKLVDLIYGRRLD
jgi:GNAT superfamily N-acetyltransferase